MSETQEKSAPPVDSSGLAHREREQKDAALGPGDRAVRTLGDPLGNPSVEPVESGQMTLPASGEIADRNAGPISSSNLGDNGSLDAEDNIDTSATGPRGLPSIGNVDPAGTGNAGNAGLGNAGTALDAARNTQSTGMVGSPVTESLSAPGVGVMDTAGASPSAGKSGIAGGGGSDTGSIGTTGVGAADNAKKS